MQSLLGFHVMAVSGRPAKKSDTNVSNMCLGGETRKAEYVCRDAVTAKQRASVESTVHF